MATPGEKTPVVNTTGVGSSWIAVVFTWHRFEDLDRRYEEMVSRLDGTSEIPSGGSGG